MVTASNSAGQASATSSPTTVVTAAPSAPANSGLPVVSGTAVQGQALSASSGSWSGTAPISYAYQWQDCDSTGSNCAPISGATSSSYTLASSDVGHTIRAVVTASNAAGSSSATSAATAAVTASHDPVVAAVGDIACAPGDTTNNCKQALTANLASAQHPDAVFTLGDNQYNSGLLSEFTGAGAYGATWGVFNPIVYPSPGNHEYAMSATAAGYFSYFGARAHTSPGYYSFNLGTWHIVALNSDCSASGCADLVTGNTTSAQTSWLQSDLAASPSACTLAFWHHPFISAGDIGNSPNMQPLWTALYNAHADIVLGGHDHLYERYAQQDPTGTATTNGIREFVVGTGGENLVPLFPSHETTNTLQFSDSSDFGVLVLTLHATSYDWAFKRVSDGAVVDSGTTACHGSGAAAASPLAAHIARARSARLFGPQLAFDARPLRSSLRAATRRGLPVAIHCSRGCDVALSVSVRSGRRARRIATYYETESQISKPYSEILLRLPARPMKGLKRATLVLRFTALDAADHHRQLTRTVVLGSR